MGDFHIVNLSPAVFRGTGMVGGDGIEPPTLSV
jgi:hypothetical protein